MCAQAPGDVGCCIQMNRASDASTSTCRFAGGRSTRSSLGLLAPFLLERGAPCYFAIVLVWSTDLSLRCSPDAGHRRWGPCRLRPRRLRPRRVRPCRGPPGRPGSGHPACPARLAQPHGRGFEVRMQFQENNTPVSSRERCCLPHPLLVAANDGRVDPSPTSCPQVSNIAGSSILCSHVCGRAQSPRVRRQRMWLTVLGPGGQNCSVRHLALHLSGCRHASAAALAARASPVSCSLAYLDS